MEQGKHRADDNGTREDTDDFSHLLALGCCTEHVACLQVLHHVASDGGRGCDDGCDEERGEHQVLFGHAEEHITDDVDESYREEEGGDGHT